jgi:anti-sigma B factor antagonist
MRAQRTGEEERRDGEVLGPRPGGNLAGQRSRGRAGPGRAVGKLGFHAPTFAKPSCCVKRGTARLRTEVQRGEPDGLRRQPVEAVERRNGAVVVRLAGELDLYNSAEVGSALEQAGGESPPRLIVDLGEVTFVDSTTLGTLVEAKKGLGETTRLLLAAPNADVRRALEVSGLGRHFDVRDTVEDALTTTP